MVISKSKFKRLPTKPISVSRRLNPIKMKCNMGNFQCGASCKPIRNKRTGKDTNCKANVPLGMARTGLMWLKDREDRVSQLNAVRQQRRAQGKSRKQDLVLDKKTGRLSQPIKSANDITPKEAAWQNYLSATGYSQSQFNQLPLKQKGRMKGAFARQEKEVAAAIAKQAREEARNAQIREEVRIAEQPVRAAIQAPKPKPKVVPSPKPKPKDVSINSRQYSGKATSKQDKSAGIIVGEMFNASGHDASDSVYFWIEGMRDNNPQAAKMIESVANAVADADPRWVLGNQDLLTVPAFKKNYPAIAKALNVNLTKAQAVEETIGKASPTRKGTPKQIPWADNIMDKLLDPFNRSGLASTQNWLRQMKADGDTKRVGQIEKTLKIIDKKDAGWIINNEKRLTPKTFRDNHEMYAIQFGVIPPLPALPKLTFDQLTKEIKRLRQPGAGNSQRLGWAEQELEKRSNSDSFAERLRKYKKSRHR